MTKCRAGFATGGAVASDLRKGIEHNIFTQQ